VVPFGYFNGCKLVFLCDCFFSAQKLVDQEQRNKTKNARCTGGGGEDSLVHEAYPDKPHVGCVNPRPGTGSVPIRDELSALVHSGPVQR
jgi:hypothetical protein